MNYSNNKIDKPLTKETMMHTNKTGLYRAKLILPKDMFFQYLIGRGGILHKVNQRHKLNLIKGALFTLDQIEAMNDYKIESIDEKLKVVTLTCTK